MKFKLSILTLLIIFLFACKKEKTTTKKQQVVSIENIKQETKEHKHHHENIKIELLNGEKWTVDKPMMQHIKNIKSDVMQFTGKSLEEYQLLAKKIDTNLELLTSNCTMTGQAHDELHKWLVPFLEKAENFSNSTTTIQAKDNYQIIKSSFKVLDQNFK